MKSYLNIKSNPLLLSQPINFSIAAFGAMGFFVYAWSALHQGHFHEDAYILFKYVENFANGFGFSFSPDLGPAEGATDFLWLVSLTGLHIMGLDVGVAALVISAIGLFSSLWFVNKLSDGQSLLVKLLLGIFTGTLLLNKLNFAAVGGFSVWAYTGLIAPLIYVYLCRIERYGYLIPLLSLGLGLLRPDGLIIGISFTLLALYKTRANRAVVKTLLFSMTIAAILGITYFVWRMSYFDSILPLPLLVKAITPSLFYGWYSNQAWALDNYLVFLIALVLVFFSFKVSKQHRAILLDCALLAIPFALHLIALGFALQSQNVGHRFQAPETFFIYSISVYIAAHCLADQLKKPVITLAAILLLMPLLISGVDQARKNYRAIAGHTYIDVFPLWFKHILPTHSLVAITEAGRLPFWADQYRYIDLVGLNTSEVAKNGLSLDYLRKQSPSAMLLWYDVGRFNSRVEDISMPQLATLQSANKLAAQGRALATTTSSSLIAVDYLLESQQYDLFAVKYWTSHHHLYAFRKGLVDIQQVKDMIRAMARREFDYSYFELRSISEQGGFLSGDVN